MYYGKRIMAGFGLAIIGSALIKIKLKDRVVSESYEQFIKINCREILKDVSLGVLQICLVGIWHDFIFRLYNKTDQLCPKCCFAGNYFVCPN